MEDGFYASEAAPPRYHSAAGASGWARLGAEEAPAAAPKASAKKLAPLARVAPTASLPGLTVTDGQCMVDGQDEAPDAVRGSAAAYAHARGCVLLRDARARGC
jgi:hypothetical protein